MIPWLGTGGGVRFPDVERALAEPNGLLAAGGDLAPATLLAAYRRGIFPWYGPGEPILWWSPDPRLVLFPERLHLGRSLRKRLRSGRYRVSLDRDFAGVVAGCAAPRPGQDGTWITPEMAQAYRRLHALGHAHSVEVWEDGVLVGGLYGVAIGRVFFGESMFSRRPDASKVALACLAARLHRCGFPVIDCQVASAHLLRLGAEPLPRRAFTALLERFCALPAPADTWEALP
ncbi:leucyl/phenylalanyl-tRNA--protein transferase [Inmirania thermothiophila]|uniref:Leucyl/phenylalanyl-tRNA--protein transferase n=1 Tax=Inmirania thermothiophila TaxID=1750597 RepID=A0A3N1Y1A8_9GAMM|nr:leucyl/phenylalanyl-tRNA--protein transferase [Inmirania thermothiophila]ROR32614.1 leucyl/phenylalanyl-tRNA--protein transferase [Inmirania thermothiophila]